MNAIEAVQRLDRLLKTPNSSSWRLAIQLLPNQTYCIAFHPVGRIQQFIEWLFGIDVSRKLDDLKDLPTLYEHVLTQAPQEPRVRNAVNASLQNLSFLFHQLYARNTTTSLVHANDILEATAVALRPNGLNATIHTRVQRVAAPPPTAFKQKIKAHFIPVFRLSDIEAVTALVRQKFPNEIPTLAQLHKDSDLQKFLTIETVAMGSIMRWMYRHQKLGKLFDNPWIAHAVTRYLGWTMKNTLPPGPNRTAKIASFFRKMNIAISPVEQGMFYSYKEMFQNHFREESSIDAAFQRDFNESTRQRRIQTQDPADVICNSDCRLRVLDIPENAKNTRFSIDGKQLTSHLERHHGYTIQNLFGNENDIQTEINRSISPNSCTEADYLLRCCLTNAVHRTRNTLVVQRLAPSDIHHFVSPSQGKILSLRELALQLKQTASGEESAQLDNLATYYQTHSSHSDLATLYIQGACPTSVSTIATQNKPTFSQNDRKIMAMRHSTGAISIHIYIGAIGVNHVDLQVDARCDQNIGDNVGSMGFGHDARRSAWPKMATSDDSISLHRQAGPIATGADTGVFDATGSTVVSLYLGGLSLCENIQAAQNLQYQDADGHTRQIEVIATMGSLLGQTKQSQLALQR